MDDDLFVLRLKSGETIELSRCTCQSCENYWWIINHKEYIPDYCCYCGIKFEKKTTIEDY